MAFTHLFYSFIILQVTQICSVGTIFPRSCVNSIVYRTIGYSISVESPHFCNFNSLSNIQVNRMCMKRRTNSGEVIIFNTQAFNTLRRTPLAVRPAKYTSKNTGATRTDIANGHSRSKHIAVNHIPAPPSVAPLDTRAITYGSLFGSCLFWFVAHAIFSCNEKKWSDAVIWVESRWTTLTDKKKAFASTPIAPLTESSRDTNRAPCPYRCLPSIDDSFSYIRPTP